MITKCKNCGREVSHTPDKKITLCYNCRTSSEPFYLQEQVKIPVIEQEKEVVAIPEVAVESSKITGRRKRSKYFGDDRLVEGTKDKVSDV